MIRLTTGGIGLPQTITRGLGAPGWLYHATFWGVLRAYLKSVAALADLAEVYYQRTPPRFDLPCLIVTPIDDDAYLNNTAGYWTNSPVQITVLANDDVTAEKLGQAACQALSPWQDDGSGNAVARPKLKAMDSYEMGGGLDFARRATLAGRGRGNKNVWALHAQWTFVIGRSLIAPASG